MKIVARSLEGHEFLYSVSSAHAVSARSANQICAMLNKIRYSLKDGEVWHVHDVDQYDTAYEYAMFNSFRLRSGRLYES